MDQWFVILFWSGPIGLGVFFAGLGFFAWAVSKARETDRRVKNDRGASSSAASD